MNNQLSTLEAKKLPSITEETKQQAMTSLESGNVIFFPSYYYALQQEEQALLSENILDPKHKNISYDYRNQRLAGLNLSTYKSASRCDEKLLRQSSRSNRL
jgi:hypothetical protein